IFYCPFCGSALREGYNFCEHCGADVSKIRKEKKEPEKKFLVCPYCGKKEEVFAEHCSNCGAELRAPAAEKWHEDVATGRIITRKGESALCGFAWILGHIIFIVFIVVLFSVILFFLPWTLPILVLILMLIVLAPILYLIFAVIAESMGKAKRRRITEEKRKQSL
ncbi:MAG: zinc-ribbon domain-containing protein, partial [Candidatus Hodarchaeota archaeon]